MGGNTGIILDRLSELGIEYEFYDHPELPAQTMDDCTELVHRFGMGAQYCKNLFVCDRQETEFFLLLIGENKKFRTAEVSPQIGRARLSFASEEKMDKLIRCKAGGASPLGLFFDEGKSVRLLVDRDLPGSEYVALHPAVNTQTVVVKVADLFEKLFPATGHDPVYVSITSYLER